MVVFACKLQLLWNMELEALTNLLTIKFLLRRDQLQENALKESVDGLVHQMSFYIANTANSEGNKTKLETACNFKVGKDLSFRNKTQYSI